MQASAALLVPQVRNRRKDDPACWFFGHIALQLTRLAGVIGSPVGIPGMDRAGGLRAAWRLRGAGSLGRSFFSGYLPQRC